ncbi:MAG: thiamine ABC transporter permease [Rhodoferax sp.]
MTTPVPHDAAAAHTRRSALLAALPVIGVFGPLLPGLLWVLASALQAQAWRALWNDPQWPQALRATVLSATLGAGLACVLAFGLASRAFPGQRWTTLQQRLPLLLAVPHAAFAVGLFFLIAPSGFIARAAAVFLSWTTPPDWVSVQDPNGLALALALALKESWFLLWTLGAVLGEQSVTRQMTQARSLGYGRMQVWHLVLWPQVLPRLAWPLAAVWAYALSVVDMALVLGPSTPPTLAVLAWQWLTDPDPLRQAQGSAAALVLMVLFVLGAALGCGLWRVARHRRAYPSGLRRRGSREPTSTWLDLATVGSGYAVLALLGLWSFAQGWFFPSLWPSALSLAWWMQADGAPFWTTLWLAAASSLLCLPAVLLWLEWGPQRGNALLYAPLIVPSLPLVAAQYAVLLRVGLDLTAVGVIWSHLLWVMPYMLLTLVGPYRAFDARLLRSARTMGLTRWQACWRVKWPLLQRAIGSAWAVGFAVSVAQYLPTLFAGGGRFSTVTTEAVALSAGGNPSVLAVQALLQIALPMAAFGLAAGYPRWASRNRLGLR